MTFLIDEEQAGNYSLPADNSGIDSPNALVYSNTELSMEPHTLAVVNGKYDNKTYLMVLDNIVYT
jgi:hypothetical protein